MEAYAFLDPTYKEFSIILDEDPGVFYDQLDVYLQDKLIYSFVRSAHPDAPSNKDLEFPQTITSIGNRFIFTFTPADLNGDSSDSFADGVYHFILSKQGTDPLPLFGIVHDKALLCCLAGALKDKDTSCDLAFVNSVNLSYALLQGSKGSILHRDVTNAVCQFEQAKCGCNTCT